MLTPHPFKVGDVVRFIEFPDMGTHTIARLWSEKARGSGHSVTYEDGQWDHVKDIELVPGSGMSVKPRKVTKADILPVDAFDLDHVVIFKNRMVVYGPTSKKFCREYISHTAEDQSSDYQIYRLASTN